MLRHLGDDDSTPQHRGAPQGGRLTYNLLRGEDSNAPRRQVPTNGPNEDQVPDVDTASGNEFSQGRKRMWIDSSLR